MKEAESPTVPHLDTNWSSVGTGWTLATVSILQGFIPLLRSCLLWEAIFKCMKLGFSAYLLSPLVPLVGRILTLLCDPYPSVLPV